MAKEKYGRYELKYFLPFNRAEELIDQVKMHIKPDPHAIVTDGLPKYSIQSVYLDTEDLKLYYEKLDGLRDRKKFRIRTYCRPNEDTDVFFEIKYRYNTQVMKDRAKFSLKDVQDLLDNNIKLEEMDLPITVRKPAERFCHYSNLMNFVPIVNVKYDRIPFIGKFDNQIRLTVDTNLSFIDHRGSRKLFEPFVEEPVPLPGAILELKFDKFMPEWMRGITRNFDIRQQSISKYAHCVDGAVFSKYEKIEI